MKMRHSISRWVYPFFLGIVIFNCLRLATDLLRYDNLWSGSLWQHIVSQLSWIVVCYLFDLQWRTVLGKRHLGHKSLMKACSAVLVSTVIPINFIALAGQLLGIYYMGNGFVDYVILNVVSLPLFLLYYFMLRNEFISIDYNKQSLLLEQVKSKQLETELDYLKAQYHPHFLFNALNTVYFQVHEDNQAARRTIEMLSELLRYQLYEVSKTVTIWDEVKFIRTYISFQRLRMSERLKLEINIDKDLKHFRIYPLLFQPLLENAFKYVGGEFVIEMGIHCYGNSVAFTVKNSLPGIQPIRRKQRGIGIDNLKRRLELLYPGKHTFEMKEEGKFFFAGLTIEVDGSEDKVCNNGR